MRRLLKILGKQTTKKFESKEKLKMTGILLAGGKSTRMGTNKAFLELDGQTLVERSLSVLQNTFVEVLISSNQPEFYPYGVRIIPDIFPEMGPLSGLHACLQAASFDQCFFVACDMPFLQEDLIRFLAGLSEGYDVTVPRAAGGLNPLHAFYHKNCLPKIENNLKSGRLKIIDFYHKCNVRYVEEHELNGFGDLAMIFSNVNTPEEWDLIQKLK